MANQSVAEFPKWHKGCGRQVVWPTQTSLGRDLNPRAMFTGYVHNY